MGLYIFVSHLSRRSSLILTMPQAYTQQIPKNRAWTRPSHRMLRFSNLIKLSPSNPIFHGSEKSRHRSTRVGNLRNNTLTSVCEKKRWNKNGEWEKRKKEKKEKRIKRARNRGPRGTLERYYRRNCEKGNTVTHGDAAENDRTGSIIHSGEEFLATVIRIPRGNGWIGFVERSARSQEQEIERFDRESEAPETLAREQSLDLSAEEKSRSNVTVSSFKSVLILFYTVANRRITEDLHRTFFRAQGFLYSRL